MTTRALRRRFTVDEYDRMGEAGIFSRDDRVELIDGEIVQMTPIGSRHAACVDRLAELLRSVLGQLAIVRVQSPIRLGSHSEPQPDLAVLRRREDFYVDAHPAPPDVLLVIEVADASADFDRVTKMPLYGQAGIPQAWLVDVAGPSLEDYRGPLAQGYYDVRTPRRGERVTLDAYPDLSLAVDDILG
jgi:Uma2 family endonuclease